MNGRWFLYEWKVVLIRVQIFWHTRGGSYMSAKPLIGAALLHKNPNTIILIWHDQNLNISVWTIQAIAGAMWTPATPTAVKTWSTPAGSQALPGHTKHVALLLLLAYSAGSTRAVILGLLVSINYNYYKPTFKLFSSQASSKFKWISYEVKVVQVDQVVE